jgi:hypothetical protein
MNPHLLDLEGDIQRPIMGTQQIVVGKNFVESENQRFLSRDFRREIKN